MYIRINIILMLNIKYTFVYKILISIIIMYKKLKNSFDEKLTMIDYYQPSLQHKFLRMS